MPLLPPAYMLPWLWAAGPTMYSMAPPQRPAHAARSRLGAEEAGTASGRWRKGRRAARGRPAGPPPRDGGSAPCPGAPGAPTTRWRQRAPARHGAPTTRWRQRPHLPRAAPLIEVGAPGLGHGPAPNALCFVNKSIKKEVREIASAVFRRGKLKKKIAFTLFTLYFIVQEN